MASVDLVLDAGAATQGRLLNSPKLPARRGGSPASVRSKSSTSSSSSTNRKVERPSAVVSQPKKSPAANSESAAEGNVPTDEQLLDRVQQLSDRAAAVKEKLEVTETAVNTLDVQLPCTICKLRFRDSFLVPCGHAACCQRCAKEVENCPLCNELVHSTKPRIKSTNEVEQLLKVLANGDDQKPKSEKGLSKMPPGLSEEEQRAYKLDRLFKYYDKDESGFIEKNELQAFMQEFIYQGLELGEEDLVAALELVDKNGDGKIDKTEFVAFVDEITRTMPRGQFDKTLNKLLDSA